MTTRNLKGTRITCLKAFLAASIFVSLLWFIGSQYPPDTFLRRSLATKIYKDKTPFLPEEKQNSISSDAHIFDSTAINRSQDNPIILDFVRKNHVFPPSKLPRSLTKAVNSLSNPKLIRILNMKRSGFFIECGANDGEFFSNTIGLEVNQNWTGLLIEGSPGLFKKLKTKNRNAWLADVCLSGHLPERIEFLKHKATFPDWRVGNGKINPGEKYKKPADLWGGKESFKKEDYASEGLVDCFPLYSILLAINVTHVDFFSLDVEGHEFKILQAIPYNRIHIEVIFVEHWLAPEGKGAIQSLLEKNGYEVVEETKSDFIFKKSKKL